MTEMPEALRQTIAVLNALLPGGLWAAFWLWAVDWRKLWPVLAQGAWAPALLLVYLGAEVWSSIAPSACRCLGFVTIPNFWWQLGSVSALAAVALFCGWLQGYFGWAPQEVRVEPPEDSHHHNRHPHAHH